MSLSDSSHSPVGGGNFPPFSPPVTSAPNPSRGTSEPSAAEIVQTGEAGAPRDLAEPPVVSSPAAPSPWAMAVDRPRPNVVPGLPDDAEAPPTFAGASAREANRPAASHDIPDVAAREASPWLVSLLVHLAILIAMALVVVVVPQRRLVEIMATLSDVEGDQFDSEALAFSSELPAQEDPALSLGPGPEVDDPFAAPAPVDVNISGGLLTSTVQAPRIGMALRGRDDGMKKRLLAAYGGNGTSEAAVSAGLKWLAKQQRPDGSWSLKGPYVDGAGFENLASATAMALLAFQGAGHSHQKGKYRDEVAKGLQYLLKLQNEEGDFFQAQGGGHHDWFYTHGQASIAVCELYGMTGDPTLREPAARAIWFCCEAQGEAGGWRYTPRHDSDTSVTGWILMALQSARMAGLEVPYDVLERVGGFLDQVASEQGSRYAYQPRHQPKRSMTAEGLLCREYLGWGPHDPRLLRGAEFLTLPENLPSYRDRDVYYWYYATQVLHHLGGSFWETWNGSMRDLLVKHQEKTGKELGSWDPGGASGDAWAHQGGRLYVTCLTLYILEVYYRHLPLYSADALLGHD